MSKRIQGFVTEFDKWGRLRCQFPTARIGKDAGNTEMQLRAYQSHHTDGYCPLHDRSFMAKVDKRSCFAYNNLGSRVKNYAELIGHTVEMEVDLLPFAGDGKGWFIKVLSIKCLD